MTIGDFIQRIKDRCFKLKLKFTDLRLRAKFIVPAFLTWIETLDSDTIKMKIQNLIFSIKPFFLNTSSNIAEWTGKTKSGKLRLLILAFLLCLIFGIAGSSYSFTANDGFISFRYAANAVKGWGYTWNPPPFEMVGGYTSFLWTALLHRLWTFGITPPHSADMMTYLFSMGTVALGFFFIRRMQMLSGMQRKSLFVFLLFCLVLLTNGTFLAFMSSGTEAAMFNFLALWWTYEAMSGKTRNPVWLSLAAVLLALTRPEGFIFVPATALILIIFMFKGHSKAKSAAALLILACIWFYYDWFNRVYGSYIPNSFTAFYQEGASSVGKDYLLSFVLEYALYFWVLFFILWAFFKFIVRRQKGFLIPLCVILTFACYAGFYVYILGGDTLEYRPFGVFIPLCTLAGIRMITENISKSFAFIAVVFGLYLLFATPIPRTHRALTENLNTRKETAFLYKPVSADAGFFVLFPERWDAAQKNIIYQGVGLRHREHKVLTEEQLKSFPSREEGSRLKKEDARLFAWDFVGVAGWILPEVYVIDTSGQNNWIAANSAQKKLGGRRLFGHEKDVPPGYVRCFNGGSNIGIDPFAGRKNFALLRSGGLTEGKIKGCENFWKTQTELGLKSKRPIKLRRK